MKKVIAIAVVAVTALVFSSMAFAAGGAEQAGSDSYHFGLTVPTSQGGFMGALTAGLKEKFTQEGQKIEVGDAELSPARQIELIENYIALGVDELIVLAVDPSGLTDVLQKAEDNGIKVLAFTQRTEVCDSYFGVDNTATGKALAEMAAEWIDQEYPDAAPGSINVAIFENRDLPEMAQRADGMHEIASMTDKVNIAEVVGVDGTPITAQSKAENLFLTNPDIDIVLAYNTDTASGINASVMALNSQVEDKSKFGIFACDYNELAIQLLKDSATDDSVVRGVIQLGSGFQAVIDDTYDLAIKILTSNDYETENYAELFKMTPDNVE